MGIIDFVKSAGRKLGIGGDDPKLSDRAASFDPAEFEALRARRRAEALQEAVEGLGLEVSGVQISVSGDTVVLDGKVSSQEEREKIVLAVGNTQGIARVEDHLEVERPQAEARFYTVVSGDTLGKIAQQHYGKASEYPVIFEANRPMLSDPDKIYPGQVLRIPALED